MHSQTRTTWTILILNYQLDTKKGFVGNGQMLKSSRRLQTGLIPCNEMRGCETTGTRLICVTHAPDSRRMRVTSANPTQMLRAPAARNKGCYFWTPLYVIHAGYIFVHWAWSVTLKGRRLLTARMAMTWPLSRKRVIDRAKARKRYKLGSRQSPWLSSIPLVINLILQEMF
jgi:hypothetical protein